MAPGTQSPGAGVGGVVYDSRVPASSTVPPRSCRQEVAESEFCLGQSQKLLEPISAICKMENTPLKSSHGIVLSENEMWRCL